MSTKLLALPIALLVLALSACGGQPATGDTAAAPDPEPAASTAPTMEPAESAEPAESPSQEAPAGPAVPTFNEDWPAAMLPDGFPDLGKVTRVIDSRTLGGRVTIYWNILSQDDAAALVETLNGWLDYDMAWQGSAYSDGLKYADGTENEILMVRARSPFEFATGELEPDFDPQFYLEISGEALPAD